MKRVVIALLLFPVLALVGYKGLRWGKRKLYAQHAPKLEAVAIESGTVRPKHPRLLLDDKTLNRVRTAKQKNTLAWQRLSAKCENDLGAAKPAGYEGFDWGNAMADLALCWHVTQERKYAERATLYLQALANDRVNVGDGKGGTEVVRHDAGYPIRTFGVYVALGYDWLHDAPTMTPALRQLMGEREQAWLSWYRQNGYQREQPIANYFCGYLAAESFAALAMHGEFPAAADWLKHARDELLGKWVVPHYAKKLDGGDWPEGWQYGELSAAEVAWVVTAFRTAMGVDLLPKIPWIKQIVNHHMHALVGGSSVIYDNGDWSEHPTKPSGLALSAVAFALDGVDDNVAAQARYMVKSQLPPVGNEHMWLQLLADGDRESDPHVKAPLSAHLPGTGVTFMRNEWSTKSVWASFQSGPTISDHQHNDQGHFELFRGADGLLVDGGTYNSAATLSHNSLVIFDNGRVLNYSPNQGTWGYKMRTTRYDDDGKSVVVVGDFTDAYLPKCVEEGCTKRVVSLVQRTLVYARPSTLFIEDRIDLDKAGDGVTWLAHMTQKPGIKGTQSSAKVGGSRVEVFTLEPNGAKLGFKKEPSGGGDGAFRQNDPWGAMWRVEVESPRGQAKRRFLHVAWAGASSDNPPSVQRVGGEGLTAAVSGGQAVLFAETTKGGKVTIPRGSEAWVVGLQPGESFEVKASGDKERCNIEVRQAAAGSRVTAGGALTVPLSGCGG